MVNRNLEPTNAATPERIPTFDSFGDVDLAWSMVDERLFGHFKKTHPELDMPALARKVADWWYEPLTGLEGHVPAALKHMLPDTLIKFVFTTYA